MSNALGWTSTSLEFHRERVQEARLEEIAEIELGCERFALMPYGKHPYRYVLAKEAFEVRLFGSKSTLERGLAAELNPHAGSVPSFVQEWRPQGDSNPRYRRESATNRTDQIGISSEL